MITLRMAAIAAFLLAPIAVAQNKCLPKIWAPANNSLILYRESDIRKITVYNCHVLEKTLGDACWGVKDGMPLINSKNYSVFTDSCVDVIKTHNLRDIHGMVHPINDAYLTSQALGIYSFTNSCREVNVTVNQFPAHVDLSQGKLFMSWGTVCNYTHGFCYDKEKGTELVWKVEHEVGGIDCKKLERFTLDANSFYLTLKDAYYVISKVNEKYIALELDRNETECGLRLNFLKDREKRMFVSAGKIDGATTVHEVIPEDLTDYVNKDKQKLYDFLIKKCHLESMTPNIYDLAPFSLRTTMEVEQVASRTDRCLNLLDEQGKALKELQEESKVLRIIIVTVLICLASGLIVIICITVGKFLVKSIRKATEVKSPKSGEEPNYNEAYETITTEYDINSFYGKEVPNGSQ